MEPLRTDLSSLKVDHMSMLQVGFLVYRLGEGFDGTLGAIYVWL